MPRSILCRYSSTNGDRNTYPCRPKAGITFPHKRCRCRPTKPTSRSCRGSRPPSTASAAPRRESHTYGGDDGLRSSSPGRAAEDLDRNTSSVAAGYGGRDPPLNSAQLQQRESRKRIRELIGELKGQGCPFLYRLPGGSQPPHQAMWDYPHMPGAAMAGAPAPWWASWPTWVGHPSPHQIPKGILPLLGLLSTRRSPSWTFPVISFLSGCLVETP